MGLLSGILRFIDKKEKDSTDPNFQKILGRAKELLLESDDGRDQEKMQHALLFLQHIEVKTGWLSEPEPLAIRLLHKKLRVLSVTEVPSQIKQAVKSEVDKLKPVSQKENEILGSVYNAAIRYYKPLVWSYTYPLDETGQVMNNAVGEWQKDRIELGANQDAYRDFTRDTSIEGKVKAKPDEVGTRIESFVGKATHYNDEQKKALVAWLKNNGGQHNNRFLDLMMMQGHFSENGALALTKSKGLEQDWRIENGKIYLHFDIIVNQLWVPDKLKAIYASQDGTIGETADLDKLEKEALIPEGQLPPFLLRTRATIELDINKEGKVIPKIVLLQVDNYAKQLLSPERLEQEKFSAPRPS
jgi:hypothetical protein